MTTPARILMTEGNTTPPAPTAGQVLLYAKTDNTFYSLNSLGVETALGGQGVGTGTVSFVSVIPVNGVSGTVATPTTTPAISITLGDITPSSVTSTGEVSGSNITGLNTGDQLIVLSGDATNEDTSTGGLLTLTTVNAAPGTFGSVTEVPVITVDAKGRVTAVSLVEISDAGGTVTSVGITGNDGITVDRPPITDAGIFTLGLGDITPDSVRALGPVTGTNLSGINTGDQVITLTGDVTGFGSSVVDATLVDTGVVAGSYVSANITIDSKGRITSAEDGSGGGGTGTVTSVGVIGNDGIIVTDSPITTSGDIALFLGNITPASIQAVGAITGSNIDGFNFGDQAIVLTGDATNDDTSTGGVLTLADTGVVADTYGSATEVPVFEVDSKGRIIGVTNTTIAGGTGTVTSVDVSGGTTGLTTTGGPITDDGTITLGGLLNVANGGTGVATLTGYVKGNGTSAFTADVTIPGTDITGDIVGNAGNITGVVPITNGGTGQITAPAAINALLPVQTGVAGRYLTTDGLAASWSATVPGGGTVTSVSAVGNDGIIVTGSPITTAGSITFDLGNITPASIQAVGAISGSNISGFTSGTNTGDQAIVLSGDATNADTSTGGALTLATVNATTGTFGSATEVPVFTVDAKGRITGVTNTTITGGGGGVTAIVAGTNITISPAEGTGIVTINSTGGSGGGTGTVTDVSVVTAAGVSGTVATSTTTPAITIALGDITPTSVTATGDITGANISGTNTGDQAIVLSGDATNLDPSSGGFLRLASTGVVLGTYGSATQVPVFEVDEKGRILSVTNTTITGGGGGVTSIVAGAGITVTPVGGTGNVTVANDGVLDIAAGDGISVTDTAGVITVFNEGVTSIVAGTGVTISASGPAGTGAVTINAAGGGGGTGTVTTVSVNTANGVSGAVATPTTTPVITLTLGAITPSSVSTSGNITAAGTITASNLSGTNTGDQVLAFTGDVTNADTSIGGVLTLADTAVVAATYGSATEVPVFTVDAKGRITGVTNTTITGGGGGGGTVTSVGLVAGEGISVTGSPITTAGDITVVNTGVTSITAGSGVTITATGPAGTGNVTINSTGGGGGATNEIVVFKYSPGAAGTLNVPDAIYSMTPGVTATITDGTTCVVSYSFTGKSSPPTSITTYGQIFSSNKFKIAAPYQQTVTTIEGGGTNLAPDIGNGLFSPANLISMQHRPADTGASGAVGQRAFLVVVFGF